MSEFPKMMYKKYPVYAVANTPEEAQELQKKGYVFEAWRPENMTLDHNPPDAEKQEKKTKG